MAKPRPCGLAKPVDAEGAKPKILPKFLKNLDFPVFFGECGERATSTFGAAHTAKNHAAAAGGAGTASTARTIYVAALVRFRGDAAPAGDLLLGGDSAAFYNQAWLRGRGGMVDTTDLSQS